MALKASFDIIGVDDGNKSFGDSNYGTVIIKGTGTFGGASIQFGYFIEGVFNAFVDNNTAKTSQFETIIDCGYGCVIGFSIGSTSITTELNIEIRGVQER